MSRYDDYIFVLWGDNFEAVPAAIFVTELRKAGLRVKIVGLTPQRILGAYGLALVPDLTLDQALSLAANTICLIIPQSASGLPNLKNDPRLQRFFELAGKNQARFVLGTLGGVDIHELQLFPAPVVDKFVVYPEGEGLFKFVCELAHVLQQEG